MFFAHSTSGTESTTEATGLLETLTHQDTWVVLLFSFLVLLGWFAVLNLFKLKLITRLLALLPMIILLALLFFSHNPLAASVLLSGGFILTFLLTFTMLAPHKK
jgi:hypothetical protein